MRNRVLVSLIIILVSLFSLPTHQLLPLTQRVSQQPVASGPSVSIWDPNVHSGNVTDPNLAPGSTFTVSINITDAPSFDSYYIIFQYNPTVLQVSSTSLNGTVFYPNITSNIIQPHLYNGLNAYVVGTTPFVGNGVLVYVTFSVRLTSLSDLKISFADLYLGNHVAATLNATSGCFNNRPAVQPVIDFTKDPSPGYYQTSLYMIGKVAVGIILPQSISHYYSWTDDQINQTITGIEDAMAFWASQQKAGDLSFYYSIHIRAPTSYEPIQIPLGSDVVWIQDVMNRLGYAGDAYGATLAFDNAIRAANHTDWAFTIFVANDDPSFNIGRFPDGEVAHAYIGGPWLTTSRFSAYAFNSGNYFTAIPAHETGHIFGATDEYDQSLEYSGYLFTPDADGSLGIMNANDLYVSASTAAQVGLMDCNGDGKPDIVETKPAISLNSTQFMFEGETAIINGTAVVAPYTHYPTGVDVTVAKISNVQFNVDQGAAMTATPVDGSFDQALEHFSFSLANLLPGTHTIYVTAITSFGQNDTTSFTVNVLVPITGSASLIKWKAMPAYHFLNLSAQKAELFLANVNVTGGPLYVYLHYQVIGGKTPVVTITSPVTSLASGLTLVSTSWQPPAVSLTYFVHATLYYSTLPLTPNASGWTVGGVKDFVFRTFIAPSHLDQTESIA